MDIVKVAVTGGPSGGKTTLIEALKKELGQRCAIVPEAASLLYRGGFPRFKSPQGAMHGQKAIYFVQKELEELIAFESQKSLIVCDRGSLDSIAYWPEDEDHFFNAFHSTRAQEIARYDWVLHLDTADAEFYDAGNPIRTETFAEAQILNEKVKKAWEGHPHRVVITQNKDFLSKISTSLAVILAIMAHQEIDKIHQIIQG